MAIRKGQVLTNLGCNMVVTRLYSEVVTRLFELVKGYDKVVETWN
jgi:hypothetical protein